MSSRLVVRTREIDPVEDLLAYASPRAPLAWLRRGNGVVAIGDAALREIRVPAGTARAENIASAWRAYAADAEIDDPVRLPGTGLVAFSALPFDTESTADAVLRVPRAMIGRHSGRTWITTFGDRPAVEPLPYGPHWSGSVGPGALSAEGYQAAVTAAIERIGRGELSKVVLARDLAGTVPAGADLRRLVRALATEYPDTWTFAVDGLIGASPETLVTVRDGAVTARVLAGTIGRGADADADTAASARLAGSTKDLDEHQYAVRSLLVSLRPFTGALAYSEHPFLLKLPNLFHLATDVETRLRNGSSALDLIGALHPTAAVAGTPTDAAIAAIRDLEPFDRGRYTGPVGWIDASGNGEWAIALRCAQFTPAADAIAITAYAGAGIVAASDPESELLETRVKFRPLIDALA